MTSCRSDGPTACQLARAGGKVGFDGFEAVALGGGHDALRVDAPDGLDGVAGGATDADHLGRGLDGDAAWQRLGADLGRAVAAQAGQRIGHAIDGELGPALAKQVRGCLARGDGVQGLRKRLRAGRFLPVELADLEADRRGVRSNGMTRLVQPGADGDDTAQRALAPGKGSHALVVDPVLEVDDDARLRLQKAGAKERGPLRVIALDGQKDGIERLLDALRLMQVQRRGVGQMLAAGPTQLQPVLFDRIDMRRPLIDQRDVVASLRSAARRPPTQSPPRP